MLNANGKYVASVCSFWCTSCPEFCTVLFIINTLLIISNKKIKNLKIPSASVTATIYRT